jgi:lipopolysaccharide/colanic/teichoic acid biosynthesis glycosyltransferase
MHKTILFQNNKQVPKLLEDELLLNMKIKFKIKFAFEWLLSACALIILSPILVLTIILVKISSPGPIFFLQRRVGYQQKEFNIIKFRSLKEKTKEENSNGFKPERLTKIGCFLRRTKIDELPQLINILKGDMEIIGPRPHIKEEFLKIEPIKMKARGEIRPGLTGLRQVNGNTGLSEAEEIYYDIFYIKNWNFFLDLKIIFRTILVIALGEKRFIKHVPPELLEKKDD